MLAVKMASEPFLFLYMFVLGANLSLLPQLSLSKICHRKFNTTVCSSLGKKIYSKEENYVYGEAAEWNIIIFAAVYIPAILSILPVGALSDLICKKKILLIPAILAFIQNAVYLTCAKFKNSHVGLLAVGASITSVYGDIQGAIMLAYAYMASVSSAEDGRTYRMAFLEGSIFIGQGLGSYITGLLLQHFGFVAAFALTLSTASLNILFVVFILPAVPSVCTSEDESHTYNMSFNATICGQLVLNSKLACIKLWQFMQNHVINPDPVILALLTAAFFANSAILGENTIATLFIKHAPLSLSAEQVGLYYLILHCTRGIGITFLAFALSRCLNLSDYTLIIIGLLSLIANHISLSFASTIPMLYGFALFSIAFPFAMSTIRALLTKLVSTEEQGTALSCIGVISLIGVTIMTFAANNLFKATANVFPGFSILLLACSSGVALVVVCCLSFISSKNIQPDRESKNELKPLMEPDEN